MYVVSLFFKTYAHVPWFHTPLMPMFPSHNGITISPPKPLCPMFRTASQVLEVLEVGRVDSSTGLSRLRCRATVDLKE